MSRSLPADLSRFPSDVQGAIRRYEEFMDKKADKIAKIKIPDAFAVVGRVHAILYETVEDGRIVFYQHDFAGKTRPNLFVGSDGKSALVRGGFTFTERGFVDD